MDMLVGTIHSLNHFVDVPIRNMCGGKKRKKTYKKKKRKKTYNENRFSRRV